MELKDLKHNDLVHFTFNGLNVKGIFDKVENNNRPIFILTDMGYENQSFETIENIELIQRPAISDEYQYIKECIADDKIRRLKLQIELREEQIERLRKGDFVPSLNDVFNFTDPYD